MLKLHGSRFFPTIQNHTADGCWRRARGRGAAVRAHLPAPQVQDRHRYPAQQRRYGSVLPCIPSHPAHFMIRSSTCAASIFPAARPNQTCTQCLPSVQLLSSMRMHLGVRWETFCPRLTGMAEAKRTHFRNAHSLITARNTPYPLQWTCSRTALGTLPLWRTGCCRATT